MDTLANITTTTDTTESPSFMPDDTGQVNEYVEAQPPPETKTNYVSKLLGLLKFAGAAIVVAAMALFLFEGISVTNDSQRFFTILGFGGALTALGLAVNKWLQDRVASRLFIGLSLASVPVIATVLGGLVFSLTDAAKALSLPTIATWQIANAAHLYWAIPIGLGVVAIIAALGLMVMARSEWRWMAPALIASNALLVIPVRDSVSITGLVVIAVVGLVLWIKQKTTNPVAFKTAEGRWALGVLFFAPVIMLARTVMLYNTDLFMGAIASALAYFGARYWLQRSTVGTKEMTVALLATFITGPAAVITTVAYIAPKLVNAPLFGNSMPGSIVCLGTVLLLSVAYDTARRNPVHFLSRFMHILILSGVGAIIVLNILFSVFGPVTTAITVGILLGFTVLNGLRNWYLEAGITLAIALSLVIHHGDWLWGTVIGTGWWGLAALGVSAVVGGAVAERYLMNRRKLTEIPV